MASLLLYAAASMDHHHLQQVPQPHLHHHLQTSVIVPAPSSSVSSSSSFASCCTTTADVAFNFSQAQIDCICDALYAERNGNRLGLLFDVLQDTIWERRESAQNEYATSKLIWKTPTPNVLRAYIYYLFHCREYDAMCQVISSAPEFPHDYHEELQHLWYDAKYAENEAKRRKQLGAVEKYRLRRKFPPPRSIWDGEDTIYSFKERTRKHLRRVYDEQPYPSQAQKRSIAQLTGLKLIQISNWFKNRRQRDKLHHVAGGTRAQPAPNILAAATAAAAFYAVPSNLQAAMLSAHDSSMNPFSGPPSGGNQ